MLSININDGQEHQRFRVKTKSTLRHKVSKWQKIVTNRTRWFSSEDDFIALGYDARRDLAQLGVNIEPFESGICHSVDIGFDVDSLDDGHALLPWEFLVSLAASTDQRKTVPCSRNLSGLQLDIAVKTAPKRLLIIESCPGKFRGVYGFAKERRTVELALGALADNSEDGRITSHVIEANNATLENIEGIVEDIRPDIIHLTGIDGHEGARRLRRPDLATSGFYLQGPNGAEQLVGPTELAKALTSGETNPRMVFFGCEYSGAKMARACVEHGALNAVGFYSVFEDSSVEQFAFDFYKAWRNANWQPTRAYSDAVTWSDGTDGSVLWRNAEDVTNTDVLEINTAGQFSSDGKPTIDDVELSVQARDEINYCSLHNNRSPFTDFRLQKSVPGPLDLRVRVEMDLPNNPRPLTYIDTIRLDDRIDLKGKIRIPLIWSAAVKQEAVRTNVLVEVQELPSGNSRTMTEFVTLLPYDEWQYDNGGEIWLPSFVLPRDPAVSDIIEGAQRLLPILFDSSIASFDGYQGSTVAGSELLGFGQVNPIDAQVRAIWSYVSYEVSPSYINPPPVYTVNSQRLRTPSEVINSRRGTCIDLSLLFCACLEYVEILPVIVLLKGHAFCAYWRSAEAHDNLRRGLIENAPGEFDFAAHIKSESPWFMSSASYDQIMYCINQGELVPLETTLLTRRSGLAEAMSEGLVNLRSQQQFRGVVDIADARRGKVRPLPLD